MLTLLLFLLVPPPLTEVQKLPTSLVDMDLSGLWEYRSLEPNREELAKGVAQLRQDKPGIYVVHYYQGGAVYTGLGVVEGEKLLVTWAVMEEKGLSRGLTIYTASGRRLLGRWQSLPGDGRWRREELRRLRVED